MAKRIWLSLLALMFPAGVAFATTPYVPISYTVANRPPASSVTPGTIATMADGPIAGASIIAVGPDWRCLSELTEKIVNPLCPPYDAKGDWAKFSADGGIISGSDILSSVGQRCVAADVGKRIEVKGAGASGVTFYTTVEACSSGNYDLAANASTTVTTADWVMGTDDLTAVLAAGAAAVDKRLLIPGGFKFYITDDINIEGTVANAETLELFGNGELVKASDCPCVIGGSSGFVRLALFYRVIWNGPRLNGQNDMLDTATTTDRITNLTLTNNRYTYILNSISTKATSYAYRTYHDSSNPLKVLYAQNNSTDGSAWEGGILMNGGTGGFRNSLITITHNDMNVPVVHPNLPAIQGTDGIIFEPDTTATGVIEKFDVIYNRVVVGDAEEDAHAIVFNAQTAHILIKEQNVNYNLVRGNTKTLQNLITVDPGDRDISGDVGATIRVIGNDFYPAATTDNFGQGIINVLGPLTIPTHRSDSLFIHGNRIHVDLASSNDCPIEVVGYYEFASIKDNIVNREKGDGTQYACGVKLENSVGRLTQSGNVFRNESNNTDQEFILTDSKTYGLKVGETMWLRRPRLDNGDGFEIGSFVGATSGTVSGCWLLSARWNHAAKFYQFCADQIGTPTSYHRLIPTSLSEGNSHDFEVLIHPNDRSVLRFRGIQVAATRDDFHIGITPLMPGQDGDFVKFTPLSTDLGATSVPTDDFGQMQEAVSFIAQAAVPGDPLTKVVTLYVREGSATKGCGTGANDCALVAKMSDSTEVTVACLVTDGACP